MKRFSLTLVLSCIIFLSFGCEKKEQPSESNDSLRYFNVNSYLDKDDDWVYEFTMVRDEKGNICSYAFDSYNLKYPHMDGYYMPIYDGDTGEEIDQVEIPMVSKIYNKTYTKEILEIIDFFENKNFSSEISVKDLDDLDTEHFSKEDLVYLFNDVFNKEYIREPGPDVYWGMEQSVEINNNHWQVALLSDYGYISRVRIDYINSETGSLRDNVESGKTKNKDMYNMILKIENYILQHNIEQTIKHFDYLPREYDSLFALLENFGR